MKLIVSSLMTMATAATGYVAVSNHLIPSNFMPTNLLPAGLFSPAQTTKDADYAGTMLPYLQASFSNISPEQGTLSAEPLVQLRQALIQDGLNDGSRQTVQMIDQLFPVLAERETFRLRMLAAEETLRDKIAREWLERSGVLASPFEHHYGALLAWREKTGHAWRIPVGFDPRWEHGREDSRGQYGRDVAEGWRHDEHRGWENNPGAHAEPARVASNTNVHHEDMDHFHHETLLENHRALEIDRRSGLEEHHGAIEEHRVGGFEEHHTALDEHRTPFSQYHTPLEEHRTGLDDHRSPLEGPHSTGTQVHPVVQQGVSHPVTTTGVSHPTTVVNHPTTVVNHPAVVSHSAPVVNNGTTISH
jgi:hypothetical protein